MQNFILYILAVLIVEFIFCFSYSKFFKIFKNSFFLEKFNNFHESSREIKVVYFRFSFGLAKFNKVSILNFQKWWVFNGLVALLPKVLHEPVDLLPHSRMAIARLPRRRLIDTL